MGSLGYNEYGILGLKQLSSSTMGSVTFGRGFSNSVVVVVVVVVVVRHTWLCQEELKQVKKLKFNLDESLEKQKE